MNGTILMLGPARGLWLTPAAADPGSLDHAAAG